MMKMSQVQTLFLRGQHLLSRSVFMLLALSALASCKGNSLDSIIDPGEEGSNTIRYSPRNLSFGNSQRSPAFVERSVILENISTSSIYITGFSSTNSDFTVLSHDCALKPLGLDSKSSCTLNLRFSPAADGDSAGVLVTNYAASPQSSSTASSELGLSGRATADGVGNAGLTFNPNIYDFGEVPQSPVTQQRSFVVRNITANRLYISGFSSNTTLFDVTAHSCPISPQPLPANATCSVTVTYEAITTGRHTGAVSVTYGTSDLNPGELETNVALSGSSNPGAPGTPAATFSPDYYDFGDQSLSSINEHTFTVTNSSSSTIFVNAISVASGSSDFTVLSTNCPTGLNPFAAGLTCTMTARFVPSSQAAKTANVRLAYGPTYARRTELESKLILAGRSSPAPISSGSVNFAPTFWDYGDVARNQSVGKIVTISNGSPGPIYVSSIERSSPAQFALSNIDCPILGAGIASGASCQVNMIFTPNADGSYATDLSVSYGANLGQATAVQAKMVLIGRSTATPIGNAALEFSPSFHDFGDIAVGAFANQVIQISNPVGNPPIFIGGLQSTSADFAVVSPTCPTGASSLAAGASCQFTLRYLPSALGTASTNVVVSYGTDQARNTNLTRTMTAAGRSTSGGTGNAAFGFDPNYWDFGDVAAGITVQKIIVVTNSSADNVFISNITRSNAAVFGVSHDCPISPTPLAPAATCTLAASFSPSTDGAQSSLISLIYGPDAPRAGNVTARLAVAGRSTAALRGNPSLTYSPNFWDFGNVARGTTQDRSFTLTNSSSASVFISAANFDTPGSFVITSNTCPTGITPLVAGGTCNITLRFSPTADVLESPTLRTFYGPDQARSGNLSANLILAARSIAVPSGQAILSASPTFRDYGDVAQTNTVTQAFTLSNSSAGPIYLSSITRSNTGAFSLTHDCPVSPAVFAAAATCTVQLSFSPNAEGAHNTQVSVAHGFAPASSTNLSYEFFAQGRSTAAASGNPVLGFAPAFTDFGDIAAGAVADQSVTITNNGTAAVYLGSASFDNARFSATANTCPTGASTLAAGASCSVTVRFAPIADGAQTGFLSYTYGPDVVRRGNLVARASLAGRSSAAPVGNTALAFNPSTWDFGDVAQGQSVQRVFTITNSSAAALHVSSATSSSARFGVATNCPISPVSLAPAATCTVTVTFAPNAESGFAADIALVYGPDAARSTNLTSQIGVVGRSTAEPTGNPGLEFNPSYRDYGNLVAGTNSTLSFTLSNIKNVPLYLGGASVTDAEYSINSNNCPTGATPLAASASCSITVRYTPDDEGTDVAELRMAYGPDQARASNLVSKAVLIGKSEPPPVGNSAITLSPNDHDFGSVGLSPAFATMDLTVANASARTLYLGPMIGFAAPFSVSATTCPLAPAGFGIGGSCTVSVRFEPIAGPQVTQTLTVNYGVSNLNTSEYNSQAQFTGRSSPNAPTNLQYTGGNASSIQFTWEANTFDQSSFEIQRCTGTACQQTWTTSATFTNIPNTDRSYSATGLLEGQVYRFRIRGIAGSTQSPWLTGAATLAFGGITSADNATGLPSSLEQINCNLDNTTGTYVGLYWNSVANAAYYQIFDTESGTPIFVKNLDAPANRVALTGLADNTNKSYLVRAFTATGVPSPNIAPTQLTTAPFTPCAVIGQSQGSGTSYKMSLQNPVGLTTDGTRLFMADRNNHRILIWNTIPSSDNVPPDVVLGQPDFESTTANNSGEKTAPALISARGLSSPWDVAVKNGKIYVADTGNNRVLVWDSIPTANFTAANWVMGQPHMSRNGAIGGGNCANASFNNGRGFNQPQGVYVDDGGYVYVSDTSNHRVLVWTQSPTSNGPAANYVLGDANMTSNCVGGSSGANNLNSPSGIYVSGNNIFVADRGNHRILRFNRASVANGLSASTVWGQADFSGSGAFCSNARLRDPYGVWGDDSTGANHIFVADYSNHRVLRFDAAKFSTNGAVADGVLGQAAVTTCGGGGAAPPTNDDSNRTAQVISGFARPSGDAAGVWVTLSARHKFQRFNYTEATTSNSPVSTLLFGQPTYGILLDRITGLNALNHLRPSGISVAGEGQDQRIAMSDYAANRVVLYSAPIQQSLPTANIVLGQTTMTSSQRDQGGSAASNTLDGPMGVWTDGNRVIVADTLNNRVLGWRSWPTTNAQAADYVMGQANMTLSGAGSGTNALSSPSHVFVSPIHAGGPNDINIWVADRGNRRVVAYQGTWKDSAPKFPADVGGSHALVLGQPATSGGAAPVSPDEYNIQVPRAVWSDGTAVAVTDSGYNRVLIWNGAIPPVTGEAADIVLGQADFYSGSANGGGAISESVLNSPTGIWVDNNRLFVVDQGNHRILVWNSFSTLTSGQSADLVVGQTNMVSGASNGGNAYPTYDLLNYPMNVLVNAGRLFITDGFNIANQQTSTNNRVLIRPSYWR